jgi:xanthine dehydrogenase iron-sulfur cluster and FAD-binding subunit A
MSIYELLSGRPDPTDEEIIDTLGGHICRCTGYQTIVEAVHLAVEKMPVPEMSVPVDTIPKSLAASRTARHGTSAADRAAGGSVLLTGQTEFIDNVVLPRMLHLRHSPQSARPRPHPVGRHQRRREAARACSRS